VPQTKPVTLRVHLFVLVVVALVPLALFASFVAKQLVEEQSAVQRARLEERVTTLLSAMDAVLHGQITALEAVTVSPAWQSGDPVFLRQHLTRLLATQPEWSTINVARADGQQVLNLLIAPGSALPRIPAEDTSLQAVLREGRPVVGDLVRGPSTDVLDFAVRTLVADAKGETYILSAVVKPASLDRLIVEQRLPAEWLAVVLDRNNRIVSRSIEVGTFRGQSASVTLRARLRSASAGWNEGVTLEGIKVETYFRRSLQSGWTVAIAVPADVFAGYGRRATSLLAAGLVLALLVGLATSSLLARRVSRPILALSAAAEAIRDNKAADVPNNLGIRELDVLGDALRLADHSLQERSELVKREHDALKAADTAKDHFLAILAHELRNPLSALRSAAYILQVGSADTDKAKDIIRRQTEQMARIIDDLLDVGRIAAGTFTIWAEPVNLSELLDEVLESLSLARRTTRHEVRVTKDDVWVNGDATRLKQVLLNLLDNALKFTPEGKQIEVRLRKDGDEALIEVLDQGPGFDPTEANRIFGLFVRGPDWSRGRGRGGLGIGLALVKKIVELHGGMVTATSGGRGKGACLRVRLPGASVTVDPKEAATSGGTEQAS
jgi:signal transduction histidine kinase